MVDTTAGHELLSFLVAYSGCNQINIRPIDEDKTTTTGCAIYYYKVMPFGLKNVGATFQWMVNKVSRS